jgi:hypothetical protein
MGFLTRLAEAWGALRGTAPRSIEERVLNLVEQRLARLAESDSAQEIYGTPVDWAQIYSFRGVPLVPVYAAETRPEKNQTLRTIQQLDQARNVGRVLEETNPNAAGLIQRLIDYNVGKGSTTDVHGTDEGEEPPRRLSRRVHDFLKVFKRVNGWLHVEEEFVWREAVDGEWFLRFWPMSPKDAEKRNLPFPVAQVRFVEPSAVRPPAGEDSEGEWSYGIHTPDFDVLDPQAYCVHDWRTGTDEIVEAQFIIHHRVGTNRNRKRGVSMLYACDGELVGASKLRHATREGEKNRASIVYFRRHKAATKEQIHAVRESEATAVAAMAGAYAGTPQAAASQVYVQPVDPGSVVDIPEGLDPLPAPASPNTEGSKSSVQAALEAVAARFGFPVWAVSGSTESAGNFAVALTAESPMTKSIERSQGRLAECSDAAQTKAIEIAIEQGELPEETLEKVDLLVSFPSPVARNKAEETTRRKTLNEAGVMSKATWSTEEGLDPEKERQQIADEQAQQPQQQAPGANGNGNGKAPSGTAPARYAQLLTGTAREQRGAPQGGDAGGEEEEAAEDEEGGPLAAALARLEAGEEGALEEVLALLDDDEAVDELMDLLTGRAPLSEQRLSEAKRVTRKEGEEWETGGRKYKRSGGKTVRVAQEKKKPEPKGGKQEAPRQGAAPPQAPAKHKHALPDDHPVGKALASLGVELTAELLDDPEKLAAAIRGAAAGKGGAAGPKSEPAAAAAAPKAEASPRARAAAGAVKDYVEKTLTPRLQALTRLKGGEQQAAHAALRAEAERALDQMGLESMSKADLLAAGKALARDVTAGTGKAEIIDRIRRAVLEPVETFVGAAG